jgi:hypothetical protein
VCNVMYLEWCMLKGVEDVGKDRFKERGDKVVDCCMCGRDVVGRPVDKM